MKPLAILAAALVAIAAVALRVALDAATWREWDAVGQSEMDDIDWLAEYRTDNSWTFPYRTASEWRNN